MAVGVGVMRNGITQIRLAQASSSWPTTVATVTVSEIKISSDDDGTTYRPIVNFSYQPEFDVRKNRKFLKKEIAS